MKGWHGLAAVLTVMTVGRASHGLAALHRLLGRSHTDAIERVARKSDCENYDQNSPCKPHDNQGRGPGLSESMAEEAENSLSGWSATRKL